MALTRRQLMAGAGGLAATSIVPWSVSAQTAAKKSAGKDPLRARVERQRTANVELRANIAELKKPAGFVTAERFKEKLGKILG